MRELLPPARTIAERDIDITSGNSSGAHHLPFPADRSDDR
jgi:hypothetical protein